MMQDSVRKATPLALALVLALSSGAAFAGDNADATFSLLSATEFSDVGAGGTVEISLAASGLVGVKQFDIVLTVTPSDAFDLAATTHAAGGGFFTFPQVGNLVAPDDAQPGQIDVGGANLLAAVDGDLEFGPITLTASSSFSAETEATIEVTFISVGPSLSARDVFDAAALGISITVNPPVTEPTLSASSATDVSLDFSGIGEGDAADGSAGEATFSVSFTDASGGAAGGQDITWTVSNSGAESVFVLGGSEVAAGGSATVTTSTGADGSASITLDSEGDKSAGSTSATVTASTTADNSEGSAANLSVSFSATWDVPVPAELASFAGQVLVDREILLQWAVPSQSNNLGWEVFRSIDQSVYERVSPLIPGEGTTDEMRTYVFVDANPPIADAVYYYLRQIDLNGTTSRSNVLEVLLTPVQILPIASALSQNFPNPFNPETTISFDLATQAQVTLTIYDLAGQEVRTLVQDQTMTPGTYRQTWDGRNAAGARVATGVYFYELKAGDFTSQKKMTLVQ